MNNNNNDSDDDDELTGFVNNSRFTPIEPPYIQPSNPATSVFAQNTITVPSVQPPNVPRVGATETPNTNPTLNNKSSGGKSKRMKKRRSKRRNSLKKRRKSLKKRRPRRR